MTRKHFAFCAKSYTEIKKQEKEGKEWMESYLPGAFDEAEELIGAARKRKGFR